MMWPNYCFKIPEKKKIRYIICSDAKNEADDQFTIAHAFMTEKFDIKGIIACHFNVCGARYKPGQTAKASYDEIMKIMDLMHLSGRYPVYLGAGMPLTDPASPVLSEGAAFIIEEANRNLFKFFRFTSIRKYATISLYMSKHCDEESTCICSITEKFQGFTSRR